MLNLELQNYIDWDVKPVFKRSDRNKFVYRVVLQFADGTKHTRMYSGFETKKRAEDSRKAAIGALANGTYVINDNVKVKDFLEYWLEYDIRIRAQSSNTYDS